MLEEYPNRAEASFLSNGFEFGFEMHYEGPRLPFDCTNLKSVLQHEHLAQEMIDKEVRLGRIAGPFSYRPISNLRCSPIGLVPKKTGGFRLITHLSYPRGSSVNDFIDSSFAEVRYSNFDNAVSMIRQLGREALIGKLDLKSAFRILRMSASDFPLLGIHLAGQYYIDKMAPMGLKVSCRAMESFSTFLNWVVKTRSGSNDIDHYLDDFFFAGPSHSGVCKSLMVQFLDLCEELNVPIAEDKTIWPCTSLVYLGYQLNTKTFEIQMPYEKQQQILCLIEETLRHKRISLKQMQSLTGSLAFCAKAMPSARAFIRRMYAAMSSVNKPHHRIRLTNAIKEDLNMWQKFLKDFNGISYMLDSEFVSSASLKLETDSAGGANLGCGVYFNGQWCFLPWPEKWADTDILRDITYLEMIPIALAVYLWKHNFKGKRLQFSIDNMSVVSIINKKTSSSERVMVLVREIVKLSLMHDFHINGTHVLSIENGKADSISRKQWDRFKCLAPEADPQPTPVPTEFWSLLAVR